MSYDSWTVVVPPPIVRNRLDRKISVAMTPCAISATCGVRYRGCRAPSGAGHWPSRAAA